jgi:serine/threonine-protein kinase
MELLRGEALHVTLHRTPRIPLDRALRIADGLLAGLEAAHQAGVVHRDLKPENVFIVEEPGVRDHVKIVDFGFARVFQGPEALDVTGEAPLVIGTVAYMAPEQLRAKVVDHRADLYGAAAILFKMLAGRLPYETSPMGTGIVAAAQFRALQLDAPPARITDFASDLGDEHMLEAVLLRALQPRADDRYTSAGEFRRALANAVGKRTMPPQASAPGVGADLWNQPASGQDNARRDPTGTPPNAAEFPPPPATAAEKRRLALAFVAVGVIVSALIALAMVRIARSG